MMRAGAAMPMAIPRPVRDADSDEARLEYCSCDPDRSRASNESINRDKVLGCPMAMVVNSELLKLVVRRWVQ
jgi:hypothetical protein